MANAVVYVDSHGSNTSPYDTWAKAATTMATAITFSGSTGTDFYIASNHAESTAGAVTLTFKGALGTPDRLFSVTSAGSTPPVTADLTAGASVTTTGASTLSLNGRCYIYGVNFNAGTGASNANFNLGGAAGSDLILESCQINLLATTNTNQVNFSSAGSVMARHTVINTPITFNGGNASGIVVNGSQLYWRNTASAIAGTATIANLFQSAARQGIAVCDGVDFSGVTSGNNIVGVISSISVFQFVNCKYASGALIARPTANGVLVDQIVTDSGATNYKQQRDTVQGTLTASTSVYNLATDGTTPISWQVVTTANCVPQAPFECFDIIQWVPAGTFANSTIMATSATGSLKTNDIWVDFEYLGSNYARSAGGTSFGAGSGTALLPQIPQGTTPASLSTAGSWATGGLGTNYKIVIPSFTTSAAGYVRFKVKVGAASLTVNIDPAVTVAA